MDEEVLNTIKAKLLEVKDIIDEATNTLEVDITESPNTGKSIAMDFDDTDLTNIQASVDNAWSILQDLSADISGFLQ